MEFEKMPALMFYDKDNVLIGSVGMPGGEAITRTAETALMDVFSVEEAERIAYFKVEDHYLIIK